MHTDNEYTKDHRNVLQLLGGYYARWRCVTIRTPDTDNITPSVFDIFRLPMPLLEELYLEAPWTMVIPWADASYPQYFPVRTRLQRFRAENVNIVYTALHPRTTCLTTLEICVRNLPASIIWAMLVESAATLVDVAMMQVHDNLVDALPAHAVTFPKLQKLLLSGSTALLPGWAGFMTMPYLESLSLASEDTLRTSQAFLQASCRSIRTLSLTDSSWSGEDAQALRSLDAVCTLRFERGSFEDSFMTALAEADLSPDNRWPWIMASLARIELFSAYPSPFESDAIIRVVRNRREAAPNAGVVAIAAVNIYVSPHVPSWLAWMIQEELKQS
ncbi:hypothetical protein EXIGLDRAFT_778891 [Exidia glandulosa HHB12029]|uniref:F-box domain-containing protein n=1 Tax=Exidia glandulosa HHB12029 TaxID=1314781 RepID=A0A165CBP9_EXIGL|nr:hypothetical protein EXIGLDRAFT_778891 [Exidia glandulosa HHB12029]